MSKITTFSRTFPAYHSRKGQPTYFVEAILTQLGIEYQYSEYLEWLYENNPKISNGFLVDFWKSLMPNIKPKSHTIRLHKKPLKVGEFINPVCWAGKPYNKTIQGFWQIKFAPDIEIKKVWDFKIAKFQDGYWIDFGSYHLSQHMELNQTILPLLASNDGLNVNELLQWFKFPIELKGQINCWNESVIY